MVVVDAGAGVVDVVPLWTEGAGVAGAGVAGGVVRAAKVVPSVREPSPAVLRTVQV